jgi:hypothetical protein
MMSSLTCGARAHHHVELSHEDTTEHDQSNQSDLSEGEEQQEDESCTATAPRDPSQLTEVGVIS